MKELSLSNLARLTLDKLQQNAVKGGGLPSCICGAISDNCRCPAGLHWTIAEETNYHKSVEESWKAASQELNPQ